MWRVFYATTFLTLFFLTKQNLLHICEQVFPHINTFVLYRGTDFHLWNKTFKVLRLSSSSSSYANYFWHKDQIKIQKTTILNYNVFCEVFFSSFCDLCLLSILKGDLPTSLQISSIDGEKELLFLVFVNLCVPPSKRSVWKKQITNIWLTRI